MNKLLIIIPIASLMLFACGRSQNGSSLNTNYDADTIVDTSTAEISAKPLMPTYVLSDKEGIMFLLLTELSTDNPQVPDSLENYKYIIYEGKFYPVAFNGFQPENKEENNYREVYYNFENLEGWLYEMEKGLLLTNPKNEYDAIWTAPLLVDENFKASTKILPIKSVEEPISEELKKRIEAQYDWQVLNGYVDYLLGDNYEYQLFNVQFKNKGDRALAISGIVCPDGKLAVKDFPAEWNVEVYSDEDGREEYAGSVWRVDDMGEFAGLGLLLATIENGNLTLYTINSGAEGCNYQNYVIKGDSLYEGGVTMSFYQAPE